VEYLVSIKDGFVATSCVAIAGLLDLTFVKSVDLLCR